MLIPLTTSGEIQHTPLLYEILINSGKRLIRKD